MIAGIWAEDKNGLIGAKGVLPWHLPADLQHFKETTMGQAILMGRKTFDGMKQRVLPGRTTIILTRDPNYQVDHESVLVMSSREAVLDWYLTQNPDHTKDLYITGGAEMFVTFKDDFEVLFQTVIDGSFEGDTYFPKAIAFETYQEVSCVTHPVDDKNNYGFTIKRYEKKR